MLRRRPGGRNDVAGQLITVTVFVVVTALTNRAVRAACTAAGIPCSRYWPLHVFHPRMPTLAEFVLAVGIFAVFPMAVRAVGYIAVPRRFAAIVALGTLLILGSNLVQGFNAGFVRPIAGGRLQYYTDAANHDVPAAQFLRDFGRIQSSLGDHGRTHAPGAVLAFVALRRMTGDRPAAIAVLLAVVSVIGSACAVRRLFERLLPAVDANQGTLLFLLLPAVQIYYCASLDALIASLLLLAAAFAASAARNRSAPLAGAIGCLMAVSMLTFAWVWAVPVMSVVLQDRLGPRRAAGCAAVATVVIAAWYVFLYYATGFDYLSALATATRLENPGGFLLFASPAAYTMTRCEDIAEIVVFLSPMPLAALLAAPRSRNAIPALRVIVAAVAGLLLLFLLGAYRTGETARTCLFIYPFLLIPAAAQAFGPNADPDSGRRLLYFTLGQTLIMQAFCSYFW